MGRVRQGIRIKSAKSKNEKAKYKLKITKYTYRKKTTNSTKKYSYVSRKVSSINGRKKI